MYHINYRPSNFEEVAGNEEVKESLEALVKDKDNIPHAILFTGPSGCGKTTLARILGSYLNCNKEDFQEINAADCTGVDFVRDIIQKAIYQPLAGDSKVYLFDEAHQISSAAQNALLKLIEDAPSHAYFIFCSTNPEKIIKTIRTRCYDYEVSPVDEDGIRDLISGVVEKEELEVSEEIQELVVQTCKGVPRVALVQLGMVKDLTDIDKAIDLVYEEELSETETIDICRAILNGKDWPSIVKKVKGLKKPNWENIRLAILGYLCACIQKEKSMTKLAYFNSLMEIFVEPLAYSGAQFDLYFRMSRAFIYKEG